MINTAQLAVELHLKELLSNAYQDVLVSKLAAKELLIERGNMSEEEARTFVDNLDNEVFINISNEFSTYVASRRKES